MKRRSFLKNSLITTGLVGAGYPLFANGLSTGDPEMYKLTILHTNDVHSRVDPFPMDDRKFPGMGGAAKRAKLVQKIRQEEKQVLLLDAGDIFQGTPYFNFYGGELEFKLMSSMKYDACTIGNHDFDGGIDGLKKQLIHANFPMLVSNYDFKDTVMNGKTKPYQVFQKGGLRVGVLGVGIQLLGLVPSNMFGDTQYLDPIENANKYAKILKYDEKCDYVICLSHLGLKYDEPEKKVSDVKLAAASENIDLIIGGHTHTFLEEPLTLKNRVGENILVNQVGWAGIVLGRLDIYFERNFRNKCVSCKNILVKN